MLAPLVINLAKVECAVVITANAQSRLSNTKIFQHSSKPETFFYINIYNWRQSTSKLEIIKIYILVVMKANYLE